MYRHPKASLESFTQYIYSCLDKIRNNNKLCVILGDFNINLLNFESHVATENFINTMSSYCYSPQILQPTRITHHSATLIDNIFFNSLDYYLMSGNLLYDISDHLPNFLVINKFSTLPKNFEMYKRCYSKMNQADFVSEVHLLNWNDILPHNNNVNDVFDSFINKITDIVDKFAPIKKLSKRQVKTLAKPWVTAGIRASIQVKNRLYKKYMRSRNTHTFAIYKLYRNKINSILRLSKKMYYNQYFITHTGNMKNIWKGIKELIMPKIHRSNIPNRIIKDGIEINDTKGIANAFNDYFSSIGGKLADAIPLISESPKSFLNASQQNCFFLYPVSTTEIQNEIKKLNPSKTCGPHSIPINLLQLVRDYLSKPLEILFNYSFETGVVPDKFKIARVIPIFKNGKKSCTNNYRPISLLSVFNKILEKLMYKRLISFVNTYDILNDNQFGFRSGHSTTQATLLITDKIQKAIEKKEYSCGIFLDLSKAFDTVNHHILIDKLQHYGIRGVAKDWFISYLNDRKQFVSIGNSVSSTCNIPCGVPQGSVLGPLLFLLYINDFCNCTEAFDFHLFADDTNLFCSHKELKQLEAEINNNLGFVNTWLCANKLSLNIQKTNFVIFHPPQKRSVDTVSLKISDNVIKQESYIKYLGIYLDCSLSWNTQIHQVAKNIKRSVGVLFKIRRNVNTKILVNLYYALIYPYLIYGLILWGNTYESNLNPIIVLQKRVVRTITFANFDEHSSPLFKVLGILKFSDLISLQNLQFMHDFNNHTLPRAFDNFFTPTNQVHQYNTRQASKCTFYMPSVRTNYGKFSIRYAGSKIWNNINENVKAMSKKCFKKNNTLTFLNSY